MSSVGWVRKKGAGMALVLTSIITGVAVLALLGIYWGEFSRWERNLEQKDRHYR